MLRAMAVDTRRLKASPSKMAPSLNSMARMSLLSRRELKRWSGSSRLAPLGKSSLILSFQISAKHRMPFCAQTAKPSGRLAMRHLISSVMSGLVLVMVFRSCARSSPFQPGRIPMMLSICSEADFSGVDVSLIAIA